MITIYELIDPETFEVRYVGLTTNTLDERFSQHCRGCESKHYHSARWIRTLKGKGLKPIPQEFYRTEDPDEADSIEISLIAYYKSLGCRLTNHHEGGQSNRLVDKKTRAKISNALKGRKQPLETIKKRVESLRGQRRTIEHKETMRQAALGRKPHPNTILRSVETHSKEFIVISPKGMKMTIKNLRQFCRDNNLDNASMSDVASGKRKQHKGWMCQKVEVCYSK